MARARTMSPAGQAGRPPRPAPGRSVPPGKLVEHRAGRLVPPGRLVEPRGPRSDDDSCRGGWSNPQTPCMEAEYSRARWSSPAALARTLSPAGPAGRAPRPGASAVGVRGASSLRTTRPASVGSSGTSTCQPPQAFPHERQGRRSFGPSVTAGTRACWSTRAGGHTALVVLQVQPRAQRPGTDTPAPPARSRKHRRPAGSPARATWPNRVPRGSGRDERYTNGRQVAPDNRRQRQRDGAGCRISGRPGRPAARPERRSRPGTPRPPRSSRPPRRDRGSGRGTGKEDLGLSGHGGRVTGT